MTLKLFEKARCSVQRREELHVDHTYDAAALELVRDIGA
jgi:hypothetical protein